jgi:hypothetical protein
MKKLLLLILLLAPLTARPQKIEVGMTKAECEKAFPVFAKSFHEHSTAVHLGNFPLHGLRGVAAFLFDNEKLLVFTWEHSKDHKEGLTKRDMANYNTLLKGLQAEWGAGKIAKSPYNKAVKEVTWVLPKARGAVRYNPDMIRVQMIDAAYLEKTKKKVK